MKTAKEIEKLAFDTILSEQGKLGFVVGYNCCQKDISQEFYDKKFTEEDLLKAFNAGIDCEFGGSPNFDEWYKLFKKD
jgi:hypothetical protein